MGRYENRNTMNRREFLKVGIAGVTVAAAGIRVIGGASEALAQTSVPKPAPISRTLGRTGLKLTIVSFGAMLTPGHEVMKAGFDFGVNYIDTARKYMNGRNEEIAAKAIKGRRDKVYVATKTLPESRSKQDLFRDVETSLAKLETDYIDVIQLHNLTGKERAFDPETRAALLELRKQGKVRFFGVTTHTNQAAVLHALVNDPDKFFDMALVAYNFQSAPEIKEAIALAAKAGMGIVAMKTQAGGYKVGALEGKSPHQAALGWVLQDANVTAAIPGMRDMDQLREDIAVMGMKLTAREDRILGRYAQAVSPYYCHLCAQCEPSCPRHVPISVVNRSLMYAEAYGSMDLARSTYEEIETAGASSCAHCLTCVARCVNGIDIRSKMLKAMALFA
jgi:uncharacterized protein